MDILGARVMGPLEPYAVGFAEDLARVGYALKTQCHFMSVLAHLSRWLDGQGLAVAGVTSAVAGQYLAARAEAGYREPSRSRVTLARLLVYLRGLGVVADEPDVAFTPVDAVLEGFRAYLLAERALRPHVVALYVASVRSFVSAMVVGGSFDVTGLSAPTVIAFLTTRSRSLAPNTLRGLACALRALLRFWFVDGQVDTDLSGCLPKVARRSAGLPKGLPPEQVAAMLASCDTSSPGGVRDRAILTLLARLGLRAGEVARLQVDDLDWRRGEILVRGKGGCRDRLPLPVDVGQMLVDYLQRGRPTKALDRCVFVRLRAPQQGLTNVAVTTVVREAARRAGLGTIYAHRLRHSAATAMLAAGAPLAEIGQVLRHRSVATTAIYAKVDMQALRALALPWPAEVTR